METGREIKSNSVWTRTRLLVWVTAYKTPLRSTGPSVLELFLGEFRLLWWWEGGADYEPSSISDSSPLLPDGCYTFDLVWH